MRLWPFVLLLFLMLPATAGQPVADVKVTAYEYFDEYYRKYYPVESICIEQLNASCQCVAEELGGVTSAEAFLGGLEVDSQYRVVVTWQGGYSNEEIYTVWEPGTITLWIDTPD